MRVIGYGLGLAVAVVLLVWVDRAAGDVANQASLLLLVVAAAALGFAAPRWAWLAALVLGLTIAAAHLWYFVAGMPLPYKTEPAGIAGPATLLLLLIPALVAGYVGAAAARAVRRRSR